MVDGNTKAIFDQLYSNIDGYKISLQSQKELSYWYSGHIYGEITYDGFINMLTKADPKKGEIFYDLGSGMGKAVIIASLLFDFSKVIGIEKLSGLFNESKKVLSNYEEITNLNKDKTHSVFFLNNDFRDVDFSNADVIFMNATCLPYELNNVLFIKKLEKLKKGTRFITCTLYIDSYEYNVSDIGKFPFTWGDERVYMSVKN
ncbi:MAG: hypothetical protein Q7J11_00310 [Candidatus Roizmanbacteria bacterium]|nr:hypothetical protein [Candidatus Roizmanbacteria bacterium]